MKVACRVIVYSSNFSSFCPPYWIRRIEFWKSEFRFGFSDFKNQYIKKIEQFKNIVSQGVSCAMSNERSNIGVVYPSNIYIKKNTGFLFSFPFEVLIDFTSIRSKLIFLQQKIGHFRSSWPPNFHSPSNLGRFSSSIKRYFYIKNRFTDLKDIAIFPFYPLFWGGRFTL